MKKQPDKITAYYYRAANKQTDLNLDNQMHRLLSHAQKNGTDTYMFFVDNGYNGLTAERPAFQNLLAAIHEKRVQKIVVVSLDRLYRSYLAAVQFLDDMERHGISICSITDDDLPLCRELYTALSTLAAVLPRKAVSADDGIYLSELEAAGQFKQ